MLSFNERMQAQERVIAARALELFLSVSGLSWGDAYPLACYERTAPATVFQGVIKSITQGKAFHPAASSREEADPISADAAAYAWQQRR